MRAIITVGLLGVLALLYACTTCIECTYTDAGGNKTEMAEYCGRNKEQEKVRRYCRTRADSLGGQCVCK